jgi:hypothetical protein
MDALAIHFISNVMGSITMPVRRLVFFWSLTGSYKGSQTYLIATEGEKRVRIQWTI